MDHRGSVRPNLKSVSTKAAIAWWAIFPDDYTRRLRKAVISLKDPKYGFYGGVFEDNKVNRSRNINTNAAILEAMLFLKRKRVTFIANSQTKESQNESGDFGKQWSSDYQTTRK